MKRIIFIMGNPNSGKTTLAKKLVPNKNRIHLDNVCLMLGIKRPELLPAEISDEMPDVDLTVGLSQKIHKFCLHLRCIDSIKLLFDEYLEVYKWRDSVKVVEGYAMQFILLEMEIAHRSMGYETYQVLMTDNEITIDGKEYSFDAAVSFLRHVVNPIYHS